MSALFVRRGERLAARKVGGEMVILAADDSSLFVLNDVGTLIWEAADGRTTVEGIADAVCREYEIDLDTARRDVAEYVSALAGAGIISTSSEAAA